MRLSVVDARCTLKSDVVTAIAVVFGVHLSKNGFALVAKRPEKTLAALDSTGSLRTDDRGQLTFYATPMSLFFSPIA